MHVYNNIFSKSLNNIFYTKIDGEVYQVKFENIIYSIDTIHTNDFLNFFEFNTHKIVTIKINVASKGEMTWYEHIYQSPFDPTKIYSSVEDCINEKHPIFKRKNFIVTMNDNIEEIFIKAECLAPSVGEWCYNGKDIYNYDIYKLRTYRWNGTQAVLERLQTNPSKFKGLVFYNSNWDSCFDLVNEEWLFDEEYVSTCYKTAKECIDNNWVKVHTF